MSKLPVSRVVTSSVSLTQGGAQSQSLSDLLVLGTSTVIDPVERMRTYSSLAAVASDFGTSAEEYLAAQAWFGQSPQPTQVRVGRWCNAAAAGGLRCSPLTAAQQLLANWTAIVNGGFKAIKDGGALTAVTGLNFSGAANLNAVAAIITAGFTTAAIPVNCVWNSVYGRFELTSPTLGAASAVSFLQAPAAGVDISAQLGGTAASSGAYTFQGQALETIDAALAIFDDRFGQLWYAAAAPAANDAAQQVASLYIQSSNNKHVWGVNTQEAGTLIATDTTDLAYLLSTLNVRRTIVQYSSTSAYAIYSALARILTTDYSAAASVITLKFKTEPGIAAESLSTTQANAVEAKNCNVFVGYDNNTVILEQGVMCDGTFADVVMGTDWLALAIQTGVYNQLYSTPTKIPQTDAGVSMLQTAIEAVCSQGVLNGLLAPGTWNSTGFGQLAPGDFLQKGYYVYAVPLSQQDPTARAARKSPPFKVAAKLAGAIHSADISIIVNQ